MQNGSLVNQNSFESKPALFGMIAFALLLSLALDSYLLQRLHVYFGGGAMNSPFALTSPSQITAFIGLSLLYDLVLFWAFWLVVQFSLKRLGACSQLRTFFIAIILWGGMIAAVDLVRWNLFLYFKEFFDLEKLMTVADGDLQNLLSFVSYKHLAVGGLAVVGTVLVFFIARLLFRTLSIGPEANERKARKIPYIALCILVMVCHFLLRDNPHMRYGLESKVSGFLVNTSWHWLTDVDFDGFSLFSAPPDSDFFSAKITPFSVEIPGNGIDDNGFAGDLSADFLPNMSERKLRAIEANGKNLVLIIVETFREDAVTAEIDGKPVMPFLNELKEQGFHTSRAVSNTGTTGKAKIGRAHV